MNKAIIVGNIVKDLEPKMASNNKLVVDFTLAVNESKDVCDYIDCVAWDKNADNLAKYVGKGAKILVEGRIKTKKWQDQNGQNRYKTYLQVDRIEFLTKMSSNSSQVQTSPSEPINAPQQQSVNNAPNQWQPNQPSEPRYEDKPLSYVDIKTDDLPFY